MGSKEIACIDSSVLSGYSKQPLEAFEGLERHVVRRQCISAYQHPFIFLCAHENFMTTWMIGFTGWCTYKQCNGTLIASLDSVRCRGCRAKRGRPCSSSLNCSWQWAANMAEHVVLVLLSGLACLHNFIFRTLQAPCACSCGTKTRRLSAIASQPYCKWTSQKNRSVLITQAG